MGTGYLLVSAATNDSGQRTTPELQRFESQVLYNPDLQRRFGIEEIKPWIELNPPRPVVYVRPSDRTERQATLRWPVEPPVLVQKPGPVRSWYLGGDTAGAGRKQPAATTQTTQTERKLPGWDQPLEAVRSLLNRLVSYESPTPTEPDQANTPPTEEVTEPTSQAVPPSVSSTTNPAASPIADPGSNDLPIFRVLRWFVIRTRPEVSVETALFKLAQFVEQENRQARQAHQDARRQRQIAPDQPAVLPYPTLTIDTRTRLKTAGGGQPTSVPVRQEAIPEPGMKTDDYYTQEYFGRIGLEVERDATHQLLKNAHNRPVFNVHNQAQGEGTVIVVLDTAPLPGQATRSELGEMSAVDWSNIEAVIDLQPQFYTTPAQEENRQKKGIAATDYPPTPAHKGVKYHGMMVANLCKTIAPKSRIILVRALDDYGEGHTPSIIEFINFMVRRAPGRTYGELFGASVGTDLAGQVWLPTSANLIFNLSLVLSGTKEEHVQAPSLLFAIDDATLKTPVFVCAAGNDSYLGVSFNPDEPAAYGYFAGYSQTDYSQIANSQTIEEPPSNGPLTYDPYNLVIGVASSAARARFLYASYSNASPLSAPSVEIKLDPGCKLNLADVERKTLVDDPTRQVFVYQQDGDYVETGNEAESRYVCWSGTSFAAPLVTGQVALLIGQREDGRRRTDPTEVKERIWTTAADPKWWNRPREINIAESL